MKAVYYKIGGPGPELYSVHIPNVDQNGWGNCVGHFHLVPSPGVKVFIFKAGAPHLEFTPEMLGAIAEALKEVNA